MKKNFRTILQSKPGVNKEPVEENFKYEECSYPDAELKTGEILVKTLYLSVDPAMRCRMNDDTGVQYMTAWKIGETIQGLGGVGVIINSQHPDFKGGDIVESSFNWPWILYYTRSQDCNQEIRKVEKNIIGENLSLPLTLLGLIGLTSYLGIKEKGHVTQGGNQTFVASGAAGACGSVAGQVTRLEGCSNIVGICGTDEKCKFLREELGFNHAINYKHEDVGQRLSETCPNGVDVYFDNVGGSISDTVIEQMSRDSHVILCGQISVYNKDVPYPPPMGDEAQKIILERNITRERFLVVNYADKFQSSLAKLLQWYKQGKIKIKETVAKGLEKAGFAFVSMMKGGI
ncbi:hypothetical protein ScPMuIL_014819 [Solemya velum]